MSVNIHPTRRHQQSCRIYFFAGGAKVLTYGGYDPAGNCDICLAGGGTGSVDDGPAAYDQIVYGSLRSVRSTRGRLRTRKQNS
jgi:hypothetical protein